MTLVLDFLIDYKISASMIVGPGNGNPPFSPSGSFNPGPSSTTPSSGDTTGFPPGFKSSAGGYWKGEGYHVAFWCVVLGLVLCNA